MVAGYLESKEGQQAFSEIGQPYAKSLQDELYDAWIKDTDTELLPKYSKHKPVEVSQIKRVRDGEGGNEFLVYSAVEYRLDKALNLTHRWRPQIGKYPIPQAEYYIQRLDFGKEDRKFKDIVSIDTGYSIPYTKENVNKIRDLGLHRDGKIEYLVETPKNIRVAVRSFEDFRNGVFEELLHFGRIPTELQRQLWLEKEGGIEGDKQRLEEHRRRIDERDIPRRIPDVDEVKSMIQQATTTAAATKAAEAEHNNKPGKGRPKRK